MTGAAAGGVVAVPAAGLVAAPALKGAAGEAGWVPVARFDDLAVNEPVQVAVVGTDVDAWSTSRGRLGAVWLLRRGEGADTLRALSAVCPHLGCLVDRQGDRFSCPCHVSSFDGDGRALEGPSPRAMDPLDVRVRDGAVEVRWVRYRLGVPERVREG